jgi:adenylyltransferase/sulfurtransferase
VNLYLNDEDVRYLPEKENSQVSGKDTLSIIPSIAGGRQGAEIGVSVRWSEKKVPHGFLGCCCARG